MDVYEKRSGIQISLFSSVVMKSKKNGNIFERYREKGKVLGTFLSLNLLAIYNQSFW